MSVPIKGISPFPLHPDYSGCFFIPDTRFPSEGGEDHEVEGRVGPTNDIGRAYLLTGLSNPPRLLSQPLPHTGENLVIPIMKVCL